MTNLDFWLGGVFKYCILLDIAATLLNRLYNLPERLKVSINLSDEVEGKLNYEIEEILRELKMPETYTADTTKKKNNK
ncbi:hypothetical protein [Campylobacter curvus]|uniref:hypothetical protein n=1 Tax=Campylobacter curvus TaxID=200 RepID=UPI00039FD6F2|nr:hypothetical protein [Campylobacter curvus]QKF60912.1 hypothetical protein CCVT_0603 [Campylobacter curvus]UEB49232.1 hypothetical protein LK426_06265 [Campylobacter curvus]